LTLACNVHVTHGIALLLVCCAVSINGNKSQVSPAVRNAVTFHLERLTSMLLTGDAVSINRLKLLLLTAVLLTLQSWICCAVSINGNKSQVRLAALPLPDHRCCAPFAA
jgi:hypothetical protein